MERYIFTIIAHFWANAIVDIIANLGTAYFLFEMLKQEKEEVDMIRFNETTRIHKEFMKGLKKPNMNKSKGRFSKSSLMGMMDSNAVIGALSQNVTIKGKSEKQLKENNRSPSRFNRKNVASR